MNFGFGFSSLYVHPGRYPPSMSAGPGAFLGQQSFPAAYDPQRARSQISPLANGMATTMRYNKTWYDKDDFEILQQLAHANDKTGKYVTPNNPYQGDTDYTAEAWEQIERIQKKYKQ